MMIDDVVTKAKAECEKFMASAPRAGKDMESAFKELLKSVDSVIAATWLTTSQFKKSQLALEIYKASRTSGPMRQETRISVLQGGFLIKEDRITDPEGSTVFASQVYKVNIEEVVKAGISAKMLAKGIADFLSDPNRSVDELAGPLKN
jgi:hypothetical protein